MSRLRPVLLFPLFLLGLLQFSCGPSISIEPNAILDGKNLSGWDLRESNLAGAKLRATNLSGANLSGADLRGASLRGANLSNAILVGANLTGADLRSCLHSRCCTEIPFCGSENKLETILTHASFENAILDSADFSDARDVTYRMIDEANSASSTRFHSFPHIIKEAKGVCEGKGIQEAAQDTFVSGSRLIHINTSSESKGSLDLLAWPLRVYDEPLSLRFLEFVICRSSEKRVSVGTTLYTQTGTITRYYSRANPLSYRQEYEFGGNKTLKLKTYRFEEIATIRSARTGEIIAEKTFYGPEPPHSETRSFTRDVEEVTGDPVSQKEIEEWIRVHTNQ